MICYMMVNEQEKQMFDAIDGRRSVSEIVESCRRICTGSRASFLKSSGRYDQVVFDAS